MEEKAQASQKIEPFNFESLDRQIKEMFPMPAESNTTVEESSKEWNDLFENVKQLWRNKAATLIGGDLYFCTRVWQAWSIGTMTEGDFKPASDSEDFIEEIAAALYKESWHSQQSLPDMEACKFYSMQDFPEKEPDEKFSKTVIVFSADENTFCDLGFYDFETNEWAILGDISMKLICWCYIPNPAAFLKGKDLKWEKHRGYC